MRTTLDLPEDLLVEAMKSSKLRTKTSVIVSALEELIRRNNIQKIRKFHGKIDLDIDLNSLRNRQ